MTDKFVEPMNCKEVRSFIPLFILDGRGMTLDECIALSDHIQSCHRCAKEYRESKFVIELIQTHRDDLIEKGIFSQPKPEDVELTDEESLQEIWDKVDRTEVRKQRNKRARQIKNVVKTSTAAAACFIIGVLGWLVLSNFNQASPHVPQQTKEVSKLSVAVELLSGNSKIVIPTGQEIKTGSNELKNLILNGEHRMMMNTNTVLAVEPLVKNHNIGCLVKLASGQIYTHVQHDGNPFVVDTVHGQAVITGTTFDIKATEDSTTLVVSEGTVQFESENGVVNVAAGQISEIVGQSTPSIPLLCNTAELTAWATGYKPGLALAHIESNTDLLDLPLSFGKDPIILEETDYDHWVGQKRDWFKLEFPRIFQLKEALAKEGIEADYPELLIKTGDVWQFVCLDGILARFTVFNPNSLLKATSNYGFDKQWLLENVPAVKYAIEKPVLTNNTSASLKAFERWLEYLDETNELVPPTPIYLFHASKYLENTRTLIWFAIRDGQYTLTDEERIEVLALLQKEVTAACKCQNDVLYPADKQQASCDDRCQKQVDSVIGYIEAMEMAEEKIVEYEIGK